VSTKKVVTAVLLLFLAIAVATLVVKEVRRGKALKAVAAARAETPVPTATVPAPPSGVGAPVGQPTETNAPVTLPPPPATRNSAAQLPVPETAPPKATSAPVSAPTPSSVPLAVKNPAPAKPTGSTVAPAATSAPVAVALSAPTSAAAVKPAPATPPPPAPAKSKVIVYYLHSTARCSNCLKIEAYTAAEVTGPLGGLISDGRLEWKVLNIDQPENAHFVQDYQLFTKSVVVSEVKNGKEVRWKRLDKVWDYLGDQQAFMKYVGDEVKAYVEGAS